MIFLALFTFFIDWRLFRNAKSVKFQQWFHHLKSMVIQKYIDGLLDFRWFILGKWQFYGYNYHFEQMRKFCLYNHLFIESQTWSKYQFVDCSTCTQLHLIKNQKGQMKVKISTGKNSFFSCYYIYICIKSTSKFVVNCILTYKYTVSVAKTLILWYIF